MKDFIATRFLKNCNMAALLATCSCLLVVTANLLDDSVQYDTQCPHNLAVVDCERNYCRDNSCPAYPYAECRLNLCGSCKAVYYVDGRKVDCNLVSFSNDKVEDECPSGVSIVNCVENPCLNKRCGGYPRAECKINQCGECKAFFYVNQQQVQCDNNIRDVPVKNTILPATLSNEVEDNCPIGIPVVTCQENPCLQARCKKHADAECRVNMCGVCNPVFYLQGKEVECDDSQLAPCLREKRIGDLSNKPHRFIVRCKENGEYEMLQCWPTVGLCWCVNQKGKELFGSRRYFPHKPDCVKIGFNRKFCEDSIYGCCPDGKSIARGPGSRGCPRLPSKCEEMQSQADLHGTFQPRCDEEGRFMTIQCKDTEGDCWCVDLDGRELEGTRTKGTPDCSVAICEDKRKDCEIYASVPGFCRKVSHYMKEYCRKSCGYCTVFETSKYYPVRPGCSSVYGCCKDLITPSKGPNDFMCPIYRSSCHMPKVVGECEAALQRYYYDVSSKQCKLFVYGGCQGNENNFESKESCENECDSIKIRKKIKEIERAAEKQEKIEEGGDIVEGYVSIPGCNSVFGCCDDGITPAIAPAREGCPSFESYCHMPAATGPCRNYFTRYFYNTETKNCDAFVYGGCGGNQNNFDSRNLCILKCIYGELREIEPLSQKTVAPATIGHKKKVASGEKIKNKDLSKPEMRQITKKLRRTSAPVYHTAPTLPRSPVRRTIPTTRRAPVRRITEPILKRKPGWTSLSECEKRRKISHQINKVLSEEKKVHLPKCHKNGKFTSIQCWKNQGYCWCADRDGNEIEGTKSSMKPVCPKNLNTERECKDRFTDKCEGYGTPSYCRRHKRFMKRNCPKTCGFCSAHVSRPGCKSKYGCCSDGITRKSHEIGGCPQYSDICLMPKASGRCLGYMERFYYDIYSGMCMEFIYGGCDGNQNNFLTKEECEFRCDLKSVVRKYKLNVATQAPTKIIYKMTEKTTKTQKHLSTVSPMSNIREAMSVSTNKFSKDIPGTSPFLNNNISKATEKSTESIMISKGIHKTSNKSAEAISKQASIVTELYPESHIKYFNVASNNLPESTDKISTEPISRTSNIVSEMSPESTAKFSSLVSTRSPMPITKISNNVPETSLKYVTKIGKDVPELSTEFASKISIIDHQTPQEYATKFSGVNHEISNKYFTKTQESNITTSADSLKNTPKTTTGILIDFIETAPIPTSKILRDIPATKPQPTTKIPLYMLETAPKPTSKSSINNIETVPAPATEISKVYVETAPIPTSKLLKDSLETTPEPDTKIPLYMLETPPKHPSRIPMNILETAPAPTSKISKVYVETAPIPTSKVSSDITETSPRLTSSMQIDILETAPIVISENKGVIHENPTKSTLKNSKFVAGTTQKPTSWSTTTKENLSKKDSITEDVTVTTSDGTTVDSTTVSTDFDFFTSSESTDYTTHTHFDDSTQNLVSTSQTGLSSADNDPEHISLNTSSTTQMKNISREKLHLTTSSQAKTAIVYPEVNYTQSAKVVDIVSNQDRTLHSSLPIGVNSLISKFYHTIGNNKKSEVLSDKTRYNMANILYTTPIPITEDRVLGGMETSSSGKILHKNISLPSENFSKDEKEMHSSSRLIKSVKTISSASILDDTKNNRLMRTIPAVVSTSPSSILDGNYSNKKIRSAKPVTSSVSIPDYRFKKKNSEAVPTPPHSVLESLSIKSPHELISTTTDLPNEIIPFTPDVLEEEPLELSNNIISDDLTLDDNLVTPSTDDYTLVFPEVITEIPYATSENFYSDIPSTYPWEVASTGEPTTSTIKDASNDTPITIPMEEKYSKAGSIVEVKDLSYKPNTTVGVKVIFTEERPKIQREEMSTKTSKIDNVFNNISSTLGITNDMEDWSSKAITPVAENYVFSEMRTTDTIKNMSNDAHTAKGVKDFPRKAHTVRIKDVSNEGDTTVFMKNKFSEPQTTVASKYISGEMQSTVKMKRMSTEPVQAIIAGDIMSEAPTAVGIEHFYTVTPEASKGVLNTTIESKMSNSPVVTIAGTTNISEAQTTVASKYVSGETQSTVKMKQISTKSDKDITMGDIISEAPKTVGMKYFYTIAPVAAKGVLNTTTESNMSTSPPVTIAETTKYSEAQTAVASKDVHEEVQSTIKMKHMSTKSNKAIIMEDIQSESPTTGGMKYFYTLTSVASKYVLNTTIDSKMSTSPLVTIVETTKVPSTVFTVSSPLKVSSELDTSEKKEAHSTTESNSVSTTDAIDWEFDDSTPFTSIRDTTVTEDIDFPTTLDYQSTTVEDEINGPTTSHLLTDIDITSEIPAEATTLSSEKQAEATTLFSEKSIDMKLRGVTTNEKFESAHELLTTMRPTMNGTHLTNAANLFSSETVTKGNKKSTNSLQGRIVTNPKLTLADACKLSPDGGDCQEYAPRYYYNATTDTCSRFTYSGCKGNGNNFQTKIECVNKCSYKPITKPFDGSTRSLQGCNSVFGCCSDRISPAKGPLGAGCPKYSTACQMPAYAGPCRALITRWYYDNRAETCKSFTWGGCSGNDNNFASDVDCLVACDEDYFNPAPVTDTAPEEDVEAVLYPGCGDSRYGCCSDGVSFPTGPNQKGCPVYKSDCRMPKVSGTCEERLIRYYYDTSEAKCMTFLFFGCGGNMNNFNTLEECSLKCEEAKSSCRDLYDLCSVWKNRGFCLTSSDVSGVYCKKTCGQCLR